MSKLGISIVNNNCDLTSKTEKFPLFRELEFHTDVKLRIYNFIIALIFF